MARRLDYLKETPSQTAGPFVHIGLAPRAAGFDIFHNDIGGGGVIGADAPGARIAVEGAVFDGFGEPVRDALIEVWQADAAGGYPESGGGFRGWGRVVPDLDTGRFAFQTVRPGRAGGQAPHLSLWLVARGINIGLQTRMYFPEDDHEGDPVLARIPAPARRATLIAAAAGPDRYRFDIRLQGDGETVFFDI